MFVYVKDQVWMRELPDQGSRVVNEALYGDQVIVVEECNGWSHIKLNQDGYEGWVKSDAIVRRQSQYLQATVSVDRLRACIYSCQDTEYGPIGEIPFGTRFQIESDALSRWIKVSLLDSSLAWIQKGDVTNNHHPLPKGDLVDFAKRFLEVPFKWGGRSSFGFDSSGFVQFLYREMGFNIPRDPKDQKSSELFQAVPLDALKVGDLIFNGMDAEKVSDVAMYIGNNQCIAATERENQSWVRITDLEKWTQADQFPAARRLTAWMPAPK
ncbi:MAG: C40 family peptidase [Chlamydiia bacterium]|nr:C40 family peptidase [Chlamydiia bacterium]